MEKFLQTVITTEEGYFLLASRTNGKWVEDWFKWPNELDNIVAAASKIKGDVYFSSHLFKTTKSTKDNVLPTRTIQADLDAARLNNLPFEPAAIIRTSEGRHHGYWVVSSPITEVMSKAITYSIPDCDLSGWTLGHRMRLPDTYNYKYDPPQKVRQLELSFNVITPEQIKLLPEPDINVTDTDVEWVNDYAPTLSIGPFELLESIKSALPIKVYTQYDKEATDRSSALWALCNAAFRAGLDRDHVFHLAYNSANNKFKTLHHGGIRELKKDILRSEQVNKAHSEDTKDMVLTLRRMSMFAFEKKANIAKMCIEVLNAQGSFLHSDDDNIWYVPMLTGRPVQLGGRSAYIETLLNVTFGLNASEVEQHYVAKSLESHARMLPDDTVISSISHYDERANTLYLHSGRRDVFRITTDQVVPMINGSNKILFPWNPMNEPFFPDSNPIDWKGVLLDRVTDNVLNMSQHEAEALIEVWFIFLLMRNSCVSRPILSLFGQPGAGKSTLFKRLYTLLYGRGRELGSVTKPEDFDHAVSSDPLVVLDNVDTWERWLPDRLALSAASSDILKRRLYTDNDSFRVRRQAVLGLTAHNPKFGREDVADRLLIIMFERLKHFLPEKFIIDSIMNTRSRLWAGIIQDVQKVLATSPPSIEQMPQFRIEDFAALGIRIAIALDVETDFRNSLRQVYMEQRLFSLEEESILVGAMQTYAEVSQRKGTSRWLTPADLWSELGQCSTDQLVFNRTYKNAVSLGRKIWAMQESLKTIFNLEYKLDPMKGTKVWMISVK